jgi:hypothetical protein
MAGEFKWKADSITSLLTTELNSLANNTGSAVGTEYDNSTNLNMYADFELNVTFGGNATADTTVDLYLIPAADGTNYDDGSATVQPLNHYVGSFSLRAATAHKVVLRNIVIPPTKFKVIVYNNGSGQAFPASGSTVKMVPYREQYT